MKKVLVSVLVCLALAVSAFASGGSDKASAGGAKGPVEVSMMLMLNPEIVLDNNPIVAAIEQKTGVKLKIIAPPLNDYWNRLGVTVGAGEMPDLITNGTDINFTKWANEGLLYNLTDVVKGYPNLMKNVSPGQWTDGSINGTIWAVPRPNAYDKWGFIINKKWLDKVGLPMPKTVADFEKVAEAFTKMDPDGNGKADTFGATFSTNFQDEGPWSLYNDWLTTAYSLSRHPGIKDVDGGYKLRQFNNLYWDYMDEMAKLYKMGVIDREWVTHKTSEGTEAVEKLAQGRVGMVGFSGKRYITEFIEKYKLNAADFVYSAPLVLQAGNAPIYMMPPSCWCSYQVNAKVSKEKLDAVMKVVDFLISEEGFILTQAGIKDRDYTSYDVKTRNLVATPAQATQALKDTSAFFAFANALDDRPFIEGGSTPEGTAKWRVENDAAEKITDKYYTAAVKVLSTLGSELPDEQRNLATLETRYMTGQDGSNELKAFVNGPWKTKTAKFQKDLADFSAQNPTIIKR